MKFKFKLTQVTVQDEDEEKEKHEKAEILEHELNNPDFLTFPKKFPSKDILKMGGLYQTFPQTLKFYSKAKVETQGKCVSIFRKAMSMTDFLIQK